MRLSEIHDYESSHDLNQRGASLHKAKVKQHFPAAFLVPVSRMYLIFDKEDGEIIGKGTTPDAAWANAAKDLPDIPPEPQDEYRNAPVKKKPQVQQPLVAPKTPSDDLESVYYVKKGFSGPDANYEGHLRYGGRPALVVFHHGMKVKLLQDEGDTVVIMRADGKESSARVPKKEFNQKTVFGKSKFLEFLRNRNK